MGKRKIYRALAWAFRILAIALAALALIGFLPGRGN